MNLLATAPTTLDLINHTELNWGTIAIAGAIVLVSTFIFILIMTGRFPGLRVRSGKNSLEVGKTQQETIPVVESGQSSELPGYGGPERRHTKPIDTRALYLAQLVVRRRVEMVNLIKSAQKAYADEVEDDFWPIFTRQIVVSEWQIETVWARLHMILYAMADLNHILDCCTDGMIDPDYLQSKTATFRRRYEKLTVRQDSNLPAWPTIEERIRSLVGQVILRYAEIAEAHEFKFSEFVATTKATTDNKELWEIIDKIASRETLEEL